MYISDFTVRLKMEFTERQKLVTSNYHLSGRGRITGQFFATADFDGDIGSVPIRSYDCNLILADVVSRPAVHAVEIHRHRIHLRLYEIFDQLNSCPLAVLIGKKLDDVMKEGKLTENGAHAVGVGVDFRTGFPPIGILDRFILHVEDFSLLWSQNFDGDQGSAFLQRVFPSADGQRSILRVISSQPLDSPGDRAGRPAFTARLDGAASRATRRWRTLLEGEISQAVIEGRRSDLGAE